MFTSPQYDNDEAMAALGRTVIDQLIGQRNKGLPDQTIGTNILNTVDQYIEEDEEPENEEDDFHDDRDDMHDDDGGSARLRFANPGSALRAASPTNPRNLPCPTCGKPNRLTPEDRAQGYQCDRCADIAEGKIIE
jgi:hypothetical protein